jgi:hypothetical protein
MEPGADFTAFAWIAGHPWLYPLLSALHVIGIALLLGSLVLFELRVWGFGATLPVRPLARLALPLTLVGFGLAGATGLGMFISQPAELLANRIFVVKIVLVMFAGLNAALFHSRGGLEKLDPFARAQTLLSLGLWVAVIICGRWIAYF